MKNVFCFPETPQPHYQHLYHQGLYSSKDMQTWEQGPLKQLVIMFSIYSYACVSYYIQPCNYKLVVHICTLLCPLYRQYTFCLDQLYRCTVILLSSLCTPVFCHYLCTLLAWSSYSAVQIKCTPIL